MYNTIRRWVFMQNGVFQTVRYSSQEGTGRRRMVAVRQSWRHDVESLSKGKVTAAL